MLLPSKHGISMGTISCFLPHQKWLYSFRKIVLQSCTPRGIIPRNPDFGGCLLSRLYWEITAFLTNSYESWIAMNQILVLQLWDGVLWRSEHFPSPGFTMSWSFAPVCLFVSITVKLVTSSRGCLAGQGGLPGALPWRVLGLVMGPQGTWEIWLRIASRLTKPPRNTHVNHKSS